MKAWPASGTTLSCWCGRKATVPFRKPGETRGPWADCPAGHRVFLSTHDVPDPDEPPTEIRVTVGAKLEAVERALIVATIRRFRLKGYRHRDIAKVLGLSYTTYATRRRTYAALGDPV